MQRLVDLGEHAVKVRKQALVASERAKDAAAATQRAHEEAWEEHARTAAEKQEISIATFAEDRATLDAIRAQVMRATATTALATSAVDRNRDALTEANLELKKLELWHGNAQGTLREMETVQERKQTDETAARLRGKTK